MSSKVAIFAKLTAQSGKRDELVAALKPMLDAVNDEPGTEIYAMHVAESEPDTVRFYEVYSDGDAAKAHSRSDAMKASGAKLAGLLAGAPEIVMATIEGAKGISV